MAGLSAYITRRNTLLFSTTALFSSWLAVHWRRETEERKRILNRNSYYVEPARSGE